jgi:hypothetical protein
MYIIIRLAPLETYPNNGQDLNHINERCLIMDLCNNKIHTYNTYNNRIIIQQTTI